MADVSFFTAVTYRGQAKSTAQSLLEKVDDYFYLGGKKAQVIGRMQEGKQCVVLSDSGCSQSLAITVLKVISYFTIIIPVILLIAKAILRATHRFEVIDPKRELEQGIEVTQDHIAAMQRLMPKIQNGESDPEIEWLSGQHDHIKIFRLKAAPDLVFKIPNLLRERSVLQDGSVLDGEAEIKKRFANMVKGKEICLAEQLNLIVIPQAKTFEMEAGGRRCTVLAERFPNVQVPGNTSPASSMQEELYRTHAQSLGKTVNQLATFVLRTGLHAVKWGSIPIIQEASGFQGDPRVALIDLKEMDNAKLGVHRLVDCLFAEDQVDAVLAQGEQNGIITPRERNEKYRSRSDEIAHDRELVEFHQRKGLLHNHGELLQIDLNTLGLKLDARVTIQVRTNGRGEPEVKLERREVTMRELAEATVAGINQSIQESTAMSAKRKRSVHLYAHPVFNPNGTIDWFASPTKGYVNQQQQLWLHRIIDALCLQRPSFRAQISERKRVRILHSGIKFYCLENLPILGSTRASKSFDFIMIDSVVRPQLKAARSCWVICSSK